MAKRQVFSAKEKEEIKNQAMTFWDQATEAQAPFFEQVNEYERLARVLLPQELEDIYAAYPDRSALVPADIYNNLNTLRAIIRSTLWKRKPFIQLHVAGQYNVLGDVVEKAETVLQAIMDMEADGRGFPSEAMKAIYQALYAGLGCTFTKWTKKFVREVQRGDDNKFTLGKKGELLFEQRMVAEYPETISLDIRRARIDPAAAERKDIRLVGYHSLMQLSDLLQLNRNPDTFYDFNEKELQESSFQREKYFEYVRAESDKFQDKTQDNHSFGDKIIEVQSFRGLFRFERADGTLDFKDLILEIGNRKVVLAIKENNLPLHGWEMFDFPAIDAQYGRLYTMGTVEPARDAFIESFVKKNQSLDDANRNVYATLAIDSSAGQNLPDYIESGNDLVMKLDLQASGLTGIGQAAGYLTRPNLGQDTFQHALVLRQDTQETMRLSETAKGQSTRGAETATEIERLVGAGLNLTDELIENLVDTYIAPTAIKKLILWNFFFADKDAELVLKDGQTVNIEAGEIDLPYRVNIQTSISQTDPAQARRFVEVFPMLRDDPGYDPGVVRETLVDVLDLPNKERLLVNAGLLEQQIDKESVGLSLGADLPVHPLENHAAHIKGHAEYIQFVDGLPEQQRTEEDLSTDALIRHIEGHQAIIEQQQASLGNTKELGGNTGTSAQPDAASQNPLPTGQTGNFTPSESRA